MQIKNVVVAGGGVLGSQIAYQSAYKGFNVTIWLRSEGSIGRCQPKLDRLHGVYLQTLEAAKTNPAAWANGFADERPDAAGIDQLKQRAEDAYHAIKLTTSYEEAFKDADLVIEAIAEDPKQKIDLYTKMQEFLPEDAIIATNSSTMLPSTFASYTGRPQKYLALHFANEIWRFNTAEIMGHAGTDQKYYDQVVEFARAIGMVPLCLHKEQPGYILNSMLVPFLSAAEALWANDVADPQTIDTTWTIATGAPAGPFRILDIVGLTTAYNIGLMDPRAKDPSSVQAKIVERLKQKIDAGELGVNAGKGFYDYTKK